MNLQLIINKSTAFYYWVQLMANWDAYSITNQAYQYYSRFVNLSDSNKKALLQIADIYKNSPDPYGINYELYSGNVVSNSATKIRSLATPLSDAYNPIWNNNRNDIIRLKTALENMDIGTRATSLLQKLNILFATSVNLNKKYPVYILPNTPGVGGSSLGKPGSNDTLMLVSTRKPKIISRQASDEKITLTIYHEYCHIFAKDSAKFNNLINSGINNAKYNGLVGFTPDGFAKEAITRTISQSDYDSLMAGLASSERVNKPLDAIKRIAQNSTPSAMRSHAICTLLSLELLPLMREYIGANRQLDNAFIQPILSALERQR